LSPAGHWSTSTQLLPGDRACLPPSPAESTSTNLTPASGRQDHTTSPSASGAIRQRRISVHRILRPTSVTIAKRPSVWDGTAADIEVIWVGREQEYFCNRGWTAKLLICPSGLGRPVWFVIARRDSDEAIHLVSRGLDCFAERLSSGAHSRDPLARNDAENVIPGRCEASNLNAQLRIGESRDSGFSPAGCPGMTIVMLNGRALARVRCREQ